jgi:post-segregation antitoxin (ccd killing protein)
MYTVIMAQMTIYVSADLREQLRAANLPVSEICQKALRGELAKARRRRMSFPTGQTPEWDTNRRT